MSTTQEATATVPAGLAAEAKATAREWIDANMDRLSEWHRHIWELAEPAWREYRSAAWYVERLRAEGFEVEEGSGGMPTAFKAEWTQGRRSGAADLRRVRRGARKLPGRRPPRRPRATG